MSHPTWVRGLKRNLKELGLKSSEVAPYVGAWIETGKSLNPYRRSFVAPYVGAWIETNPSRHTFANGRVAPYVGAWIETLNRVFHSLRLFSRTLRGCVD